ncbi:MAG: CRISPR-associated protein Cas4 [Bacteroidales bacterium]|jgi:CRISPR-associated exonuclease Cas4|nr:CRISPR-associated protein Cas4 [Bacteroidales bacterium]
MYYDDDQMLMLSGIQHYMFCPRQWALIHIEQQWDENRLTAEGQLLHQNVDNPAYRQKNGDVITLRSVHIASHSLGLYGVTDAIELLPSDGQQDAITHPRYPGYWKPYPIEYKRGHRKPDERDEVQLAAQVICLEEMYGIHIPEAALYYNETRHREKVTIDDNLRQLTYELSDAMHKTFESGFTPKVEEKRGCRSCSLIDICAPELAKKVSVAYYLKKSLDEETA